MTEPENKYIDISVPSVFEIPDLVERLENRR